ncbi:hypothetical protein [Tellurirhabdus bombi]|uniref:hypothetical protein n=1 Tax=Tellurirhabdus bombi TaxID=2907205 RepID=UPI001F30C2D1|nr:hypothetical protein [Tellurirhabdus bombi]
MNYAADIKLSLYRAGFTNEIGKDLFIKRGAVEYPVSELLERGFRDRKCSNIWNVTKKVIKGILYSNLLTDSPHNDLIIKIGDKELALAGLLAEQFAAIGKRAKEALGDDFSGHRENPEHVLPKEYLKDLGHAGVFNPLQSYLVGKAYWKDGAPDKIKYDVGDKVWGVNKKGVFFRRAITEIIVHDFKCEFKYNRVTLYRVTGDNILYMNHHLHLTYAEAVADRETTWKVERKREEDAEAEARTKAAERFNKAKEGLRRINQERWEKEEREMAELNKDYSFLDEPESALVFLFGLSLFFLACVYGAKRLPEYGNAAIVLGVIVGLIFAGLLSAFFFKIRWRPNPKTNIKLPYIPPHPASDADESSK